MNTTDKLLDALGLESKSDPVNSILGAVGIFSAGLPVGAGLGLLFAPKPGRELRARFNEKLGQFRRNAANVHAGGSSVSSDAGVPRY